MKVNDGKAVFSNIPVGLASTFPSNNTFSSTLSLPGEIGFGFSYKIVKDLTVAVDFNHTFWSSYDSLGFNYAVNTSAVTDAKSPRLYENASCVRFGAQYAASAKVSVRAGLFFDQTPVRDGYVSPELPDNNKTGLTAGGTFKLDESIVLDISLLYENVPSRTQKNIESGLDGTFQTSVIAPGLGLTYIFNKSNKTTLK
jgi:long-chain fatty acid transport protein